MKYVREVQILSNEQSKSIFVTIYFWISGKCRYLAFLTSIDGHAVQFILYQLISQLTR